jgi:membrane dipeptidase
MLEAVAVNGGVVGVNFVPGFLDADFARRSDALRKTLEPRLKAIDRRHRRNVDEARKARWALFNDQARTLPPVTVDRVADHIDHIVSVAGIDHVGLGSDFDGFGVTVQGLSDCAELPLITAKLVERGYSDGDISKILGGNFLRVFEKVIK